MFGYKVQETKRGWSSPAEPEGCHKPHHSGQLLWWGGPFCRRRKMLKVGGALNKVARVARAKIFGPCPLFIETTPILRSWCTEQKSLGWSNEEMNSKSIRTDFITTYSWASHGLAHQNMARPNTVWKNTALAVGALPPFPVGWGGACAPGALPVPTPMHSFIVMVIDNCGLYGPPSAAVIGKCGKQEIR